MPDRIDARVPVRLADRMPDRLADGALVLVERGLDVLPPRGGAAARLADFAPSHETIDPLLACQCCAGRAPFAAELGRLFTERARGEVAFFRSVVAVGTPRGLDQARDALASDPFLLGRYRLAADERAPGLRQDREATGPA